MGGLHKTSFVQYSIQYRSNEAGQEKSASHIHISELSLTLVVKDEGGVIMEQICAFELSRKVIFTNLELHFCRLSRTKF